MLLTLYYMYATLMQWWKISSMRNKISKVMTNQSALVLYQKDKNDFEKHQANIKDLLFFTESRIGCTMIPKRKILLRSWMPFSSSTLFPYLRNNLKLSSPSFPVLIHADLNSFRSGNHFDKIQITEHGIPVAWTVGDQFNIVIKTDLDNFSKLVSCFLTNNMLINEGMEVLQIETIDLEGEPKIVENESVFKRIKWPYPVSSHKQWHKFIEELKFACKKNVGQISKNGNICNLEDIKTIPIIISEPKSDENHFESTSKHKSSKSELKPEKKSHKRHSDKSNFTVEKVEKTEKKDKRSTSKEKEKLKHSSSHDKLKHKDNDKKSDKKDADKHKKGKKMVKKHSKENVLEEKPVEEKQHKESIEKPIKSIPDKSDTKKVFVKAKPPNVLVYADSLETKINVKNVLNQVLNTNRYTVYELPASGAPHFTDNCTLVVVSGSVNPSLTPHLLNYLLNGGNLLCVCSDFLNSVLHTFTTAEVREHELVRFSYGGWKRIQMMHHIFCYQASPAKKHFSQDSDPNSSNHSSSGNSPIAPRTPSTVELHHNNKNYTVQVRVLGQEETWQTPSILLANVKGNSGKAVFSQVHLEIDPTQYQSDENKYAALKESNSARLEILKDILSSHLEMDCDASEKVFEDYKPAYFLGKHDSKSKLLSEISGLVENKLKLSKLTLHFCGKGIDPPKASESYLPVLIHSCPENFSTIEYFENLQTKLFGRLVIYSDIMTSSMDILDKHKFEHGIVVLPARQTIGQGRGGNAWLSPVGCAMFSLQLHVPIESPLGKSLPLLQHLIAVSIASGIRSQPGYEEIDIGLKWPNDIYANSSVKIGGIILNSTVDSSLAVINIGSGTNLSNSLPTTCINKLILAYNETKGTNLKTLSYEKYLALVFTELERIYDVVQSGNSDYLYELYYKYWLHTGAEITVHTSDGSSREVKVTGIDNFGYLTVISKDGLSSSVEPDGNSFDMMQGLIAPKIR